MPRWESSAEGEGEGAAASARSVAVLRGLSRPWTLSVYEVWMKMWNGLPRTCRLSTGFKEPPKPTMTLRKYFPDIGSM